MNTLSRSLVGVGLAVAMFAGTFFVASAAVSPGDPYPVDAAITVPGSTLEQSEVLSPAAYGELTDEQADAGSLSSSVGTMQVVVPDGSEEGLPEGAVPPSIVAAAAALDSVAGDLADIISATPEGEEPGASASVPSLDPASDPCALEGADPDGCPAGVTVELFALHPGEALEVAASADPPTASGMSSNIWCPSSDLPETVLSLGAFTNDTAAVTITYWPQGSVATPQSVSLAQVQTYVEGSARHCGATGPLDAGVYEARALAINADGVISDTYAFTFDSRGHPTVPSMRVLPLGNNWLWVGVYHSPYDTAQIKGYPLTDDGPQSCVDAMPATVTGLYYDINTHTTEMSSEWVTARNFQSAYTRLTSALLYMPEGTSAGICGYTFDADDPSWDREVPDRVESTTAAAPDSWEAVATLRSLNVNRPGTVTMRAQTHMGGYCGPLVQETADVPAGDGRVVVPIGRELCRIAGQNMSLLVSTHSRNASGTVDVGTSGARFTILGQSCTGDCPAPEPQVYLVYLPGLGTDDCAQTNEGECYGLRATFGARAVIDVTWERGGTGSRTEWGIGGIADVTPDETPSDVARFDQRARVATTLSTDGFTATGTTTLRWDRSGTYSVQLNGDCLNGAPITTPPAPITGMTRPDGDGVFRADINLRLLCPGTTYSLVVTYTDDSGVTRVVAPEGVPGVTPDEIWRAGIFASGQRMVEITAKIEVLTADNLDASWQLVDSFAQVQDATISMPFAPSMTERCYSSRHESSAPGRGQVVLSRTFDVQPILYITTDWFYAPRSDTCYFRRSDGWVVPDNATVTLAQLLAGAEIRGTLVRRDFPDEDTPNLPFTYRLILTGEYVDE